MSLYFSLAIPTLQGEKKVNNKKKGDDSSYNIVHGAYGEPTINRPSLTSGMCICLQKVRLLKVFTRNIHFFHI